jgi:hypothetical protein
MMDRRLQDALDSRLEQDMPPIEWGVDPRVPIDRRRLDVLSKLLANHGTKWACYEANESALRLIPDEQGLYMFVWRIPLLFDTERYGGFCFRQVMYVGRAGPDGSSTVRDRFKREYLKYIQADPSFLWSARGSTRAERLGRLLLLRELEFWVCYQRDSDRSLQNWEDDLIKVFSPPGNVVNKSPTAKLGPSRVAF